MLIAALYRLLFDCNVVPGAAVPDKVLCWVICQKHSCGTVLQISLHRLQQLLLPHPYTACMDIMSMKPNIPMCHYFTHIA